MAIKQQQMLKIFLEKNVKISYLQLFYWDIKIYANALFSTWSTSKIILCIQLKIDHFKLTTHTVQSECLNIIHLCKYFLWHWTSSTWSPAVRRKFTVKFSPTIPRRWNLCAFLLHKKNDFLPYLLHKISYLYTFHSMNYLLL